MYKKKNIFSGGSKKTRKTNKNKFIELDKMIINTNLTDEQNIIKLKNNKEKYEDLVKKKTNIYNNLLTNLSSTDDEIETAELELEDTKNKLSLAEINVNLKQSIINNNKHKKKYKNTATKTNKLITDAELLNFYVILNTVKQYNIYTIILLSKIKKLKKQTLKNPNNTSFKNQLSKHLKKTLLFSTESYNKTNNLYKKIIASNITKINSYKSDISNAKNIAKSLMLNIKNIQEKIEKKDILDKEIIEKLTEKNEPKVEKIIESENRSLFENLSSLFRF
jgi:hypothetical protein